MRVHGVLWIVETLKAAGVCDDVLLIRALETWKADRSVFLPIVESAYAFDGNAKRPNTARQKIRFRVIVHNIICNKPIRFGP